MSTEMFKYFFIGVGAVFAIMVIAYLILKKKLESSEVRQIKKLREGTEEKKHTLEVFYQKAYIKYLKVPFLKRYLLKIRRRLEIINIDDEYLTRKQTAAVLTKTLVIVFPVCILTIIIARNNILLLSILLLFELFMVDTLIEGMVDKIDDKLLKQQINFFSEMRHAYHEFNMVEEAVYQVSQDDEEPEMARQAEKIYDVLISDDPESELEKYYDIAPNSYLKEFAGISYLTKEFGDRKVERSSLYLKNLNNITQEMQLEILKRDKLNYVFQSLSIISIAPILGLEPLKNWCTSQFNFTESFYLGRKGMLCQIIVILVTFICYTLIRKLKDNGSVNTNIKNVENPWQEKLYKIPVIKRIVHMFIPKEGTKEYRLLKTTMKDAASKDKMEWIFINRLVICIITFFASVVLLAELHQTEIKYVYTDPTSNYDLIR